MKYSVTHNSDGNELKNELGTSNRICKCGSWINHWKIYTGQKTIPDCVVKDCRNKAEVGAHVEFTRVDQERGLSYIAPMCDEHNKQRNLVFRSKPGYYLARGNVSETCGS